jgi:hypothetical protein
MKKLVFAALAVISCWITGCTGKDSGGMSDKTKKNLASAQAIVKMFESGDFSKAGDYIAADGVDHSGMKGETKGLDNIKAEFDEMGKSMSNMKNETVKELADDDYTYQWLKETSTLKVDEMGMKAGSTNTFNVIEVSKFNADSKVTDHWSFIYANDMMKMMPQMPMENKMDTTMKK